MNKKILFCLLIMIILLLSRLFVTFQKLDIKVKFNNKVEEEKKQDIIRISCVGDSITYGFGLENINYSWVTLLPKKLGINYQSTNYGLSNRTLLSTGDYPYMNEEIANNFWNNEEEIIILMLGTNDTKQINWDAKRFEEEYEDIVKRMLQKENHPKLYIMTPPKIFGDNTSPNFPNNIIMRDELIPIIRVIAERHNIEVINIYKLTASHPEWFWDNLHPNRDGNEAMAEEIAKVIRKTYIHKSNLVTLSYD